MNIDGTTQPGWSTTPVVEINGTSAGGSATGVRTLSDGTTIRSLAINRFGADGIEVDSTSSNTLIVGNHIGLSANGLIDRGGRNAPAVRVTGMPTMSGYGLSLQAGVTNELLPVVERRMAVRRVRLR